MKHRQVIPHLFIFNDKLPITNDKGGGGGGHQVGLKSTIHANSALKSIFHTLSYTKSKYTHTKFKNEVRKPKNINLQLNTFTCCHRNIFTMSFRPDFTQIKNNIV